MGNNQSSKNPVDVITRLAMGQYTRRGMLGWLGRAGLVLSGVVAGITGGITLEPGVVGACIVHPGPCFGECQNCWSACYTGGATCTCDCTQYNCACNNFHANGYYDCFGHFHCACPSC